MSFEAMRNRLNYRGGAAQHDRMVADRLRSMKAAIKSSYQSGTFENIFNKKIAQGLFVPNVQTEDYDTKMLSVPFEAEFKVGDVFVWKNTETKWIIFLQDRTELAYFRGRCRRCDYEVKWVDGDRQLQSTVLSVIGPSVPTMRTSSSMGAGVSEDFPNAVLKILTPNNERNLAFFKRYNHFILKGTTYQVETVDTLSMPGVIQMTAKEYYSNLVDDDVENSISNVWNVQPIIKTHETNYGIEGPVVTKPLLKNKFSTFTSGGEWVILEKDNPKYKNFPAEFEGKDISKNEIVVIWTSLKSGNFTVGYRKDGNLLYQKNVLVESL